MNYRFSSNRDEMDVEIIHGFLSSSYWSQNIPVETIKLALRNSLCFGVFDGDNQVGFARMITDSATYAYLADVFILESHQGKGLAKKLIEYVLGHSQLQGLRRIVLATRDAHGLYKKFGFKSLANPDTFMEIWTPGIYLSSKTGDN